MTPAAAGPEDGRIPVTYHDPCHLKKSLGVAAQPRALLQANPAYILKEMPESDWCCGCGGSFNLQHYEISAAIGKRKRDNIATSGCRVVATGCPACMLQITDMLSQAGHAGAGETYGGDLCRVLEGALSFNDQDLSWQPSNRDQIKSDLEGGPNLPFGGVQLLLLYHSLMPKKFRIFWSSQLQVVVSSALSLWAQASVSIFWSRIFRAAIRALIFSRSSGLS